MKFTSLSTILVCKEAKMNNLFNHHGAGPPEAWGPMQPHRLHRLKPGPVKHCAQCWNWFNPFFFCSFEMLEVTAVNDVASTWIPQRFVCDTENWCHPNFSFLGLYWNELRTTEWFQPNRDMGNHALRPRTWRSCIDSGHLFVGRRTRVCH